MIEEQQGSTSSDETGSWSTEWDGIVDLGKAIASRLSIEDHDVLGRWMSYRVAELLDRGEEDESARAVITETVLKLWAHRWSWPEGWPPASPRRQLAWLFGSDRVDHLEPADPTAQFMRRVADALSDEYQFWLWVAGSTIDADDEDAAEVFESHLPWSEQRMIRRLRELDRRAAAAAEEDAEVAPEPDRERLARDELNSLLRARRSLLSDALQLTLSEIPSGKPTPR